MQVGEGSLRERHKSQTTATSAATTGAAATTDYTAIAVAMTTASQADCLDVLVQLVMTVMKLMVVARVMNWRRYGTPKDLDS